MILLSTPTAIAEHQDVASIRSDHRLMRPYAN